MYEIDELLNNEWKYIYDSENMQEIDKIAFKLTLKGIPCRILMDEKLLIFLNGSVHQYKYWKDRYVRDEKLKRILKR